MITKNQNITTEKTFRKELIDLGIQLGQCCWDAYSGSRFGFPRVSMLPDDDARRRANDLFQTGFGARMFVCPPAGFRDTDRETSESEAMWKIFLGTMDGKVVLGCGTYPDTPNFVLDWAKGFFLEGFRAGTIAVQIIRKL